MLATHRNRVLGPVGAAVAPFLLVLAAAGCNAEAPSPPADPAPPPSPDPAPPAPDDPAPPGSAAVTVSVSTAAPGETVEVRAEGFPAGETVDVGFGPPRSEYEVVTQATVGEDGQVETEVRIPNWAERGDAYVMVVSAPGADPRATSDPFVVGSEGDPIQVSGELTDEGVECPALRGPFGTLYTLAVADIEYGPGTEVRVEGTIAGVSMCMQGTTIDVQTIEPR